MAIDRIQKKGRIDGSDPVMDSRIIDQFMDDVINSNFQTSTSVADIINTITIIINNNFILKRISTSITIPIETVVLQRQPIIEDGVEIRILQGGEFLIL